MFNLNFEPLNEFEIAQRDLQAAFEIGVEVVSPYRVMHARGSPIELNCSLAAEGTRQDTGSTTLNDVRPSGSTSTSRLHTFIHAYKCLFH